MCVNVRGTFAPGFKAVRDAFAASFDGKPQMGAAVAILQHGRVVVDLWAGSADLAQRRDWKAATPSLIFSCTKGLTSVLAAALVQQGRLDYDARVVDYWPEFGAAGKADTLISDLLAHRAGLAAPRAPLSTEEVLDWGTVVALLAAQEPLWTPGSGHAYHPHTHGWLIGEVVRRVTARTVGQHFARTVAHPLNVEAWIGLPRSKRRRVARVRLGQTMLESGRRDARSAPADQVGWIQRSMTLGEAFPYELVGDGSGFNSTRVQRAEIPGAGGIATARALATIWSATFVETNGVRLLNDATLRRATTVQSEGRPVWDVPKPWMRWGMGFQLDSEARRYLTRSGYGHDGAGGQVAFAEPELGIGFAFITNQMEGPGDPRATLIIDELRNTVSATG